MRRSIQSSSPATGAIIACVADVVGTVSELWRFPVKSLLGERVAAVDVGDRGVAFDRWWSVLGADGKLGSGKTTRRFRKMPGLFTMRSFLDDETGAAWVELPDGWCGAVDDAETARRVSAVVGEPVTLAAEADVRHHDDSPIHLLTDASLAWLQARVPVADLDVRRFRPNVLVTTGGDPALVEEAWIGRTLAVGSARLRVTAPAVRCVMATQAQDDLSFEPAILRVLEAANDLCLGVYATIESAGTIVVDDEVVVE